MNIAIYGRQFNDSVLPFVQQVFTYLEQHKVDVYIYTDLNDHLSGKINLPEGHKIFKRDDKLKGLIDVCITLGGDGTLLDTLAFIHDSGIPVIGINFGRLGFLASINKSDIAAAIFAVVNNNFTLDSRDLISIDSELKIVGDGNFALNDITIHKRDDAAMIITRVFLDDEFLNAYWGDGIIIS